MFPQTEEGEEEDDNEPLNMSWPTGNLKEQIIYILVFPITGLLWLTIPDVRKEVIFSAPFTARTKLFTSHEI